MSELMHRKTSALINIMRKLQIKISLFKVWMLKKVGGKFDCSVCDSLKSLEGAPKEIGGSFDCSYCKSLTLLDGAPKKVGRNFSCDKCASQFTIEDVKKISNVKGKIKC